MYVSAFPEGLLVVVGRQIIPNDWKLPIFSQSLDGKVTPNCSKRYDQRAALAEELVGSEDLRWESFSDWHLGVIVVEEFVMLRCQSNLC